MARPLPKNLELLYQMMPPDVAAKMYDQHTFVVDGVEFVSGYVPESTAERFYIVKSEELLGMYDAFMAEHRPARIFELGIAEGGSVALMALLPHVTRLVAIDNEPNRLDALDEFVATRHLGQVVSTYYGVDQADRQALIEIVERDLGGGGIDLVIDDCSHDYDLTVASFDVLFPRVRPGGWYLIEDWSQAVKGAFLFEEQGIAYDLHASGSRPLTLLGLELALVMTTAPGVIDRVTMNHEFVAVRRGPDPIDPSSFRLADHLQSPAFDSFLVPRRTA
jgi:Methyltransferase domain